MEKEINVCQISFQKAVSLRNRARFISTKLLAVGVMNFKPRLKSLIFVLPPILTFFKLILSNRAIVRILELPNN